MGLDNRKLLKNELRIAFEHLKEHIGIDLSVWIDICVNKAFIDEAREHVLPYTTFSDFPDTIKSMCLPHDLTGYYVIYDNGILHLARITYKVGGENAYWVNPDVDADRINNESDDDSDPNE